MLEQRKETEQEINHRLQKACCDKQALQERVASMSRTLGNIENEKREMERSTMRLEKDKNALRKCLDKVSFVLDLLQFILAEKYFNKKMLNYLYILYQLKQSD